jgi:diguanylate cyclase (GGDEF)-like protein
MNVAVMFINIDDFKMANDNFGHDYGDEVIKEEAKRMKNITCEEDTIARLG